MNNYNATNKRPGGYQHNVNNNNNNNNSRLSGFSTDSREVKRGQSERSRGERVGGDRIVDAKGIYDRGFEVWTKSSIVLAAEGAKSAEEINQIIQEVIKRNDTLVAEEVLSLLSQLNTIVYRRNEPELDEVTKKTYFQLAKMVVDLMNDARGREKLIPADLKEFLEGLCRHVRVPKGDEIQLAINELSIEIGRRLSAETERASFSFSELCDSLSYINKYPHYAYEKDVEKTSKLLLQEIIFRMSLVDNSQINYTCYDLSALASGLNKGGKKLLSEKAFENLLLFMARAVYNNLHYGSSSTITQFVRYEQLITVLVSDKAILEKNQDVKYAVDKLLGLMGGLLSKPRNGPRIINLSEIVELLIRVCGNREFAIGSANLKDLCVVIAQDLVFSTELTRNINYKSGDPVKMNSIFINMCFRDDAIDQYFVKSKENYIVKCKSNISYAYNLCVADFAMGGTLINAEEARFIYSSIKHASSEIKPTMHKKALVNYYLTAKVGTLSKTVLVGDIDLLEKKFFEAGKKDFVNTIRQVVKVKRPDLTFSTQERMGPDTYADIALKDSLGSVKYVVQYQDKSDFAGPNTTWVSSFKEMLFVKMTQLIPVKVPYNYADNLNKKKGEHFIYFERLLENMDKTAPKWN